MTSPTRPAVPGDSPELARARRRWLDLVRNELPVAALRRPDWPLRRDHCFARVILDAIHGRPWREVLAAPAYRHMDAGALAAAIEVAEAILDGTADLAMLDDRSLVMRGKAPKPAR